MPDITMCSGKDCPKAEQCYRHTAEPSPHWQSFFMTTPIKEDGSCEYFSPNRGEANVHDK